MPLLFRVETKLKIAWKNPYFLDWSTIWSLITNNQWVTLSDMSTEIRRGSKVFLAGEDCIYEQIKKRERKRNTKKYCLFCEMFSSTRSDAKWSEAWLHVIYGPNLYVFVAREEREKKENEAIMRAVVSLDLYLCRLVISRLLRFFPSLKKIIGT